MLVCLCSAVSAGRPLQHILTSSLPDPHCHCFCCRPRGYRASKGRRKHQADTPFITLATVRPNGMPAARTVVFRGFLEAFLDDQPAPELDDGEDHEEERGEERGAPGASTNGPPPLPEHVQVASAPPQPDHSTTPPEIAVLEAQTALTFITDARASKVEELARQPLAEVVWWFGASWEQFRIQGRVVLVGPQHPLEPLRSARARLWRKASDSTREQFAWPEPGEECVGSVTAAALPMTAQAAAGDNPPDNFLLGVLAPTFVDHLHLTKPVSIRHIHWPLPAAAQDDSPAEWASQRVNP